MKAIPHHISTAEVSSAKQTERKHPLPIELVTLAYTLFTTILILIFWDTIGDPWRLLEGRAFVVGGMGLIFLFYRAHPSGFCLLMRYLFPLSLLGYWYPDTYEFCQLFPNLDHWFAKADAALFGCQPSVEFYRLLPDKLWSELFHLGYFSYYPLIALTVLLPLFVHREQFERTAFIVLASFFLYYTIYLFLPVTGPQYYFHAVGQDTILSGHYPEVGYYFRTHTALAPSPGPDGMFCRLVEATQASGERPTAAFPSSHVGISTILMVLLWRINRPVCLCAVPFYLLLCCATVYIQAHYLVDVMGGLVSAVVFYSFTSWLWGKFMYIRLAKTSSSR